MLLQAVLSYINSSYKGLLAVFYTWLTYGRVEGGVVYHTCNSGAIWRVGDIIVCICCLVSEVSLPERLLKDQRQTVKRPNASNTTSKIFVSPGYQSNRRAVTRLGDSGPTSCQGQKVLTCL